jgi:4-hydroxybenzoate polyprenyltransferase
VQGVMATATVKVLTLHLPAFAPLITTPSPLWLALTVNAVAAALLRVPYSLQERKQPREELNLKWSVRVLNYVLAAVVICNLWILFADSQCRQWSCQSSDQHAA